MATAHHLGEHQTTRLYVGTAGGLHILEPRTQAPWHTEHHVLVDCDISACAWDQRAPHIIYVGTAAGELWRSNDQGATWCAIGTNLPAGKIWTIAPDIHAPPGALYIGLDGGHLFHSTDQGATWQECHGLRALPHAEDWWGPFGPAIFHSLLLVAERPGLIYAGLSVVGVLASDDSGATWRDTTANIPRVPHERDGGPELADVHRLAIHPLAPERLYATTHYGTFRSDDGAHTWENIGAGLPFAMTRPLALHPNDPDTLYVIAHESSSDTELPIIRGPLLVHRSRDGGRTWQALGNGLPPQANCSVLREALVADHITPCALYLGTNRGHVFASTDEGDTWQPIAELKRSVRVVCVLHSDP